MRKSTLKCYISTTNTSTDIPLLYKMLPISTDIQFLVPCQIVQIFSGSLKNETKEAQSKCNTDCMYEHLWKNPARGTNFLHQIYQSIPYKLCEPLLKNNKKLAHVMVITWQSVKRHSSPINVIFHIGRTESIPKILHTLIIGQDHLSICEKIPKVLHGTKEECNIPWLCAEFVHRF